MDVAKKQAEKTFNTAERPVKLWMSYFVDEDPAVLFDSVPDFLEPLILQCKNDKSMNLPEEFKKHCDNDELFMIRLDITSKPFNKDENIHQDMMPIISNSIGFLNFCVKTVYSSILQSESRMEKFKNISLELDVDTLTYKPVYISDDCMECNVLKNRLDELKRCKDNLKKAQEDTEELQEQIDKKVTLYQLELVKILTKIKTAQIDYNKKKTLELADKDRITITYKWIEKKDIPEYQRFTNLQSVSKTMFEDSLSDSDSYNSEDMNNNIDDLNNLFD